MEKHSETWNKQTEEQRQVHQERPPSPASTCLSMNSDKSQDRHITFQHGDPKETSRQIGLLLCNRQVPEERPPSPASTCLSMKSDKSQDRGITFQHGDPLETSRQVPEERPPSPASICLSMKSDKSQDHGITFQHGDPLETSRQVPEERPPSPASICLSMKSDKSQDRGITFQHGDPLEKPSSKMEDNISHADSSQSTQIPQCNLDHILQDLENKIFAFLRNELKRFKWILSPDYIEKSEHKDDEDDSDAREGALKMALHFLKTMDQKELAETLQKNEKDTVCRIELKKSLQNRYQSVFEGIQTQAGSALLEKIYTEVYITEGGSGKVNEEHEIRQIEMKSKLSAGQETPIKCSDIFKLLPGQDKPIRRVITKGVAGIGKTVSVQKYILDWAEGKENQDIHFIFPIPFREINLIREKQFSMMALLHHLFSEIKPLTFQSQEKCKVLFILDGLDECQPQLNFQKSHSLTDVAEVSSVDLLLTNLITGHLFPTALLWITSRPAAANQIPPVCVDRVTEVQGFSDPQKVEYFRKRISDQNVAEGVISHLRSSRSLYIMCHIPVFCWIAATVLQQFIAGGEKVPKTLTEMYTYFLVFQNRQRGLKFDDVHDEDPQWNQDSLLGLGRLAYEQLEKGNLIFYENDLKECGVDVEEAAVRSGIFTQMFQEVSGVILGKVYSFVHLSIQEYLAALYVFLMMRNKRKDLVSIEQPQASNLWLERMFPPKMQELITTMQKSAVDKAFQCEDGRFDLFLRFLLGLSLYPNQNRLHGLLQNQHIQTDNEETIRYIKGRISEASSSERVINLFHCLNELNDHSLVEEIQSFLSAGTLSEAQLSPGQWSALVFVLLTSEDKLDVFDLEKYGKSDEVLIRLLPVLEESQTALLNHCNLTKQSCAVLASVICKPSSKLKSLDLSGNNIGDIEVGEICNGLKISICTLEMLNLSNCSFGEEGFRVLVSALRSNPSHMRELQLSGNKAEDSGVKHLSSLLEDPNCKLEKLNLFNCSFGEESIRALASALRSNPSHMRELQLSENIAGYSGMKHLSSLLADLNCKLEKLYLSSCSFREEGFRALASALRSNPSHMRELQLSENIAGDSGVRHLSYLLDDSNCKLDKLDLSKCSFGEEGFRTLASALRSNPSHMRELQLSGNQAGDSGVKHLSSLLEDPNCKLEKLHLSKCSFGEEGFRTLASALRSNPSHMRELQLNGNKAGDSGVKHLSSLLEDSNCKLEKLDLRYCDITDEGFRCLAAALRSKPSALRKIWLWGNPLGPSVEKLLSELQQDPNCKDIKICICRQVPEERPPSPASTCLSMKSDKSQDRGIDFQHGDRKETSRQVPEERPPSPTSSCLSMESDESQERGITFQHGDPQETSSKIEGNISHAACDQLTQIPQCNLDHILQELENKIFAFLRNELKRFKRILSPDYIEKFEHKDDNDDETNAREGALKMALHFLRTMDQKELAEKLQENEKDVLCQAELKKSLQNRYQVVFEGIQMQGGSAFLEKIYTEVYITEGEKRKVNEEHEVRQIEMKSKISTGQETPIKCSDIFKLLPGQEKPIRRVITKGVAGIGKTVSVQKYILDWAEGKENQDIHFIFPLPFRELNLIREKQYSMMALLHHLFSEMKPLTFHSQEKRKVLFILDGLDECRPQLNFQKSHSLTDVTEVSSVDILLTNLIKGYLFPTALVWITSRPAAANQIPPVCVDRVTEVQGFSEPQKEEYFRKRISDQNVAEGVISHLRSSRSLYIMCHIPVFCWIAATVLQQVMAGGAKVPKTLTEMYTYFLVFQNRQRGLKFDDVHDEDPEWNQDSLLGLGRLAYEQLEKGNLIFYEKDLKECRVDVEEAAVRSGIFTQMFQEVSGVILGKVYSFVHLSIQEYLAALYVFLMMRNKRKDLVSIEQPQASNLWLERMFPPKMQKSMAAMQKSAVDKAFQCEDGRFDLFLRFLLGLSLDSNQSQLHSLLQNQHLQTDNDETIRYIKGRISKVPSSERVINLFHCLNELNDHSLVEEIQSFLSTGTLSEAQLSPGQWSAVVFVLLTSEDKLDVFDLQKYGKSDEGLVRLLPVLEESQTALLNDCNLTKESCAAMASVLRKPSSKLKSLDLSSNNIGDTEVGEICNGLKNSICTLEMLNLSNCGFGEDGFRALASALRSNPSHMRELQLSGNIAGNSGVKHLSSLLEDPNCKLEKLHLYYCSFREEGFRALVSALRSNPSHMRELQLSGNKAGDSGVKHLSSLLEDPNCKLEKLDLHYCSFGEKGFRALASALRSNPSHIRELQLSGNKAGDSGVKHLSSLLEDPNCKLEKLDLSSCSFGEEGFRALSSALRSNPSHMRELQVSWNKAGDSGVKHLSSLLENPNCKLEKLDLHYCSFGEEGFRALASALRSNPSHMRELQLSRNKAGDSGVKHLSSLLEDPNCKLEKLDLRYCDITDEGFGCLGAALRSKPSALREIWLWGNPLGPSAEKLLSELQQDPNCKDIKICK
ncbi:uncharacterized protein LOC134466145 [Engraulis encrasicolus]|uniref:uncharacterized protein LOC134466145 n=1 Tax=Engraulis encrasicolus TaxID=184585 RepID=UPI002FD27A63